MANNQASTDPLAKANRPIFKAMTRKQICDKYRLGTTKTFQRWCDKADLKLPAGLLPPAQVKRIWDTFGEWEE